MRCSHRPMRGAINFDLFMTEDMPLVEGCYRLEEGICMFLYFGIRRRSRESGVKKELVWESGVTGLNIIVPDDTKLDKAVVLQPLSDALGVTTWSEVRGPDPMQHR